MIGNSTGGKVKIDKLTHEVAYYKRHYFGVKAERLPVEQGQLFEETLAADMAAITEELAQLSETKPEGPSEAQTPAAGTAAHRDSPRTGINDLRLWLPTEAHR
jgi:transposase